MIRIRKWNRFESIIRISFCMVFCVFEIIFQWHCLIPFWILKWLFICMVVASPIIIGWTETIHNYKYYYVILGMVGFSSGTIHNWNVLIWDKLTWLVYCWPKPFYHMLWSISLELIPWIIGLRWKYVVYGNISNRWSKHQTIAWIQSNYCVLWCLSNISKHCIVSLIEASKKIFTKWL